MAQSLNPNPHHHFCPGLRKQDARKQISAANPHTDCFVTPLFSMPWPARIVPSRQRTMGHRVNSEDHHGAQLAMSSPKFSLEVLCEGRGTGLRSRTMGGDVSRGKILT